CSRVAALRLLALDRDADWNAQRRSWRTLHALRLDISLWRLEPAHGTRADKAMAFFRSIHVSEQLPVVQGDNVLLRAPQMADFAEWAALREKSRDFLVPWEPTWPEDDLTRSAFRRRLRRYNEDMRGDLTYPFLLFRKSDNVMLGGLTLTNIRRGVA